MENNILYSSEMTQITAAEDSTGSKVIDAIIKGLGKFGRSLGSLASSLIDRGYDIGRVTREPTATVWQIGNDEYKKTKGESGYLCEVTLKPHPIQAGDEPTYSLEIKTVSGLQQHSFVAENVTEAKAAKVIRSTMSAWDAADNKSAESIKEQYELLIDRSNELRSKIKTDIQTAREKVKAADNSGSLAAALDDLEREATDHVEDLTKQFQRAFRDSKSMEDKMSQCTKMSDALEDAESTLTKAIKQIVGQSTETEPSESDEAENEGEDVSSEEQAAEDLFQMENGETTQASTQIDFKKNIIACVCRNTQDNESTVELKRIYSAIEPEAVLKALETVLYDASVQETLPEGQTVAIQITDEDNDYDINMLQEVTSVQLRDVFVQLLKVYYTFYFNMLTIRHNAIGADGATICELCMVYEDKAQEQINTLLQRCASITASVPNPASFIGPEGAVDGMISLDYDAGLAQLQANVEMLVNCIELYRCNFDEVFNTELAEWADDWSQNNETFLDRMQS